jgi:hypothetical protein
MEGLDELDRSILASLQEDEDRSLEEIASPTCSSKQRPKLLFREIPGDAPLDLGTKA